METIIKEMFLAIDGREFENQTECELYENKITGEYISQLPQFCVPIIPFQDVNIFAQKAYYIASETDLVYLTTYVKGVCPYLEKNGVPDPFVPGLFAPGWFVVFLGSDGFSTMLSLGCFTSEIMLVANKVLESAAACEKSICKKSENSCKSE